MSFFKDKVALVTGATAGIGKATALALAEEGAQLIVCGRDPEALARISAEIDVRSRCLLARRVDVSDRLQVRALAEETHRLVPSVDILVNNAGVASAGAFVETPLADFESVLAVNLWGVLHCCHYFVPRMAARGRGHIVNVASMLGYAALPQTVAYNTSKFAVLGLSESLRAELEPAGVGVSTVCPGMVSTQINARSLMRGSGDPKELRRHLDEVFRKRMYPPEKVAKAILRAIRRRRAVVPVNVEAWLLYYLSRFAPSLIAPLGRSATRKMTNVPAAPAKAIPAENRPLLGAASTPRTPETDAGTWVAATGTEGFLLAELEWRRRIAEVLGDDDEISALVESREFVRADRC